MTMNKLVHKNSTKRMLAVKKFIKEYRAMSVLEKEHPWLSLLLLEILENKNKEKIGGGIETKLKNLEDEEVKIIGAALNFIVASSVNESVGVDSWISKYGSMKELSTEHKFLIPMIKTVATRIATAVDWLMISRACATGMLSVVDMASDIYMINFYYQTGQTFYANATFIFIFCSLLIQCFAILTLYKDDKKAVRRELIYVLTLQKTGRARFQVLKQEKNQGCALDPVMEYLCVSIS
jgi:hypothetical protein